MTDEITTPHAALRGRIGWLCRVLQALVVGWPIWILYIIFAYWGDRAFVVKKIREMFDIDVSGAAQFQITETVSMQLVLWTVLAAMCFSLWRVLSLYLRGDIFSIDAALWLRRAGLFGLVATIADLPSRSLIVLIMAQHLPESAMKHRGYISSDDPLHLMIALIVIAFAHIQKSAAEIAADHAQIV